MNKAIATEGFVAGESLLVRCGYLETATDIFTIPMARHGEGTIWAAIDTIRAYIGERLVYQYFKISGSKEYREHFYNFLYEGQIPGEESRRVKDILYAEESFISSLVPDIKDSETSMGRMPVFSNTRVISQPVTLTSTCDLRPAICFLEGGGVLHDISGSIHVGDPDSR